VKFDGQQFHCTCPFEGDRYANVLYSMGTKAYGETPALVGAFLKDLGFELPPFPREKELSPDLRSLATKAARGLKIGDQPGRHKPPVKAKAPTSPREGLEAFHGDEVPPPSLADERREEPQEQPAQAIADRRASKRRRTDAAKSEAAGSDHRSWTEEDLKILIDMKNDKKGKYSYKSIAKKLRREEEDVRNRWEKHLAENAATP